MKYVLTISFTFFVLSGFTQQLPLHRSIQGFQYAEVVTGAETGKLPLVIAFHYSGGTPEETVKDYDALKNPVRLILVKGNFRKRNGYSYYPVDYYKQDSATQFSLARITVDSLARFVKSIEDKYQQRAIVTGISQGGDIPLMLAIYHPDLCRAAFAFAAVINPQVINTINRKSSDVPIHIYQGEADEIVPVAYTRMKVKALENILNITLYTYPGLGHDISPQMKSDYSKMIDALTRN